MKIPKLWEAVAEVEADTIEAALHYCNWEKKKAAELLGIHRAVLDRKMVEHEIKRPEFGHDVL